MVSQAEATSFGLDGERLVRPDWSGRGLANLAPTVLRLLSPSVASELPPLAASVVPDAMRSAIKTVVVVVADGLGHLQLQREIAAGNAPRLGELIRRAAEGQDTQQVAYTPITSVFPTTTVAALGTVNSGATPAEHGLLAFSLYLQEFGTVAEMIRWGPAGQRTSFADPEFGVSPESFFWAETVYSRLHSGGVERTFAVNPHHFAGTALTRMLHQHATYTGYIATSSLEPIVSRLVADSDAPTYIYAYWPTVDTIAHALGPNSPEHASEVSAFDHQFGRLLDSLPRRGDTLVMLTADHGHVDSGPDHCIPLADHPELLAMLALPAAGERRVLYLHTRDGAAEDLAAYARERLREVAWPMTRDQAVALGLFGPSGLSERAASRVGDVLLFAKRNLQLMPPVEPLPTPDGPAPRPPLIFRGLHGGLAPEEALVPLLAYRA
ncbi:MAG: alkaline phosphatase family protein [Chloroflexota bacterium]